MKAITFTLSNSNIVRFRKRLMVSIKAFTLLLNFNFRFSTMVEFTAE